MITPQYTMTVSDLNVQASLAKLTPAIRNELRKTIVSLTAQLLAQVRAREPVRTGYMRSQTVSFVDERESMIRGRVRILATGRGRRVAAAFGALEYGAHKRIAVGAHTRGRGRVMGYERTVNIAAQRFLRGPAAAMRPRIIAELEAALGRAVGELTAVINREAIMTALFNLLNSAPMVVDFTANLIAGTTEISGISNPAGLTVGMPLMGDGLAADTVLTAITPPLAEISLPAIHDHYGAPIRQGFQTTRRRWFDVNNEQDMPALYLVEHSEIHGQRPDGGGAMILLDCNIEIHTRIGADPYAIPATMLNALIESIEGAIYPLPQHFRQTLGQYGVRYCRIEGEIVKDQGVSGQIASAVIPIRIAVAQY